MEGGVRRQVTLVAGLIFASVALARADKASFVWPPLTGEKELAEVKALASPLGLVLAQRESKITIRSVGYEPFGVVREEFLRFLVVSESGVKNADFEVVGEAEGKVSLLEGRTVLPDGTVLALREQDVEKLEVHTGPKRKLMKSFAKVHFPNPSVGAVLDLHFTVETDGWVSVFAAPMATPGIPVLTGRFFVTIKTRPSPLGWSLITMGPGKAPVRSTDRRDTMEATIQRHTPPPSEPLSVPFHHQVMTLVAFINLDGIRGVQSRPGQPFSHSSSVDLWGRVEPEVVGDSALMEYFTRYLKDEDKQNESFLKKGLALNHAQLEAIAPAQSRLEGRVAGLYRYLQQNLRWNPNFEEPKDVRDLLKEGMSQTRQGTVAMAALLRQAGIPYRIGYVANRYFFRFSPVIHNEYLFGFEPVVIVDRPQAAPLLLMAGELPLPAGALPSVYQHALVLVPGPEGKVEAFHTPPNPPTADLVVYRFALELAESGAASGELRIEKRGAPAWAFASWELIKDAAMAGKARAKGEKERKKREWEEAEQSWLVDESKLPGSLFTVTQPRVQQVARHGEQSLELQAHLATVNLTVEAGGKVLLPAFPLFAGFQSPFTAVTRSTPIWNDTAGRFVLEGSVKLPRECKVIHVPPAWQLNGPLETAVTAEVSAKEEDGRTVLISRLAYDIPPVVPIPEYPSWRAFFTYLEKTGQERVVLNCASEDAQ